MHSKEGRRARSGRNRGMVLVTIALWVWPSTLAVFSSPGMKRRRSAMRVQSQRLRTWTEPLPGSVERKPRSPRPPTPGTSARPVCRARWSRLLRHRAEFGLTVGSAYDIQWPQFNGTRAGCGANNPDKCLVSPTCDGDSKASKAAVVTAWASANNGYWGASSNSTIEKEILDVIRNRRHYYAKGPMVTTPSAPSTQVHTISAVSRLAQVARPGLPG